MNEVTVQNQNQNVDIHRAAEQFKSEIALAAPEIQKMLPKHLEYERFQGMVIATVASDPYLLKCTQSSLIRSVIDAADLGLSLNKNMREADILPVYKGGKYVAECRPRAIGMMKLARNSGAVVKITAHEIYENDIFDVSYGLDEHLEHKPTPLGKAKGAIIGAYCAWQLKDGTKQFEVIDMTRIERARSASESYKRDIEKKTNYSPWNRDFGEMVRKTAIRAASKYMPMNNDSDAFLRAMNLDNEIDGEFTVAPDGGEEPQGQQASSAGESQVKALEAKIGAGEPEKPQEGNAQTAAAKGRGKGTGTRSSKSAQQPSDTSPQEKSQSGTATTASRSEPPPREEPPPADPDDYGNIPASMRRPQPEPGNATQAVDRNAPKPGAPMQDLPGDDPEVKIDWKATAHDLRKKVLAVGSDLAQWKKLTTEMKPTLDRMKVEAPDWYQRLHSEILAKEEWLRQ